MVDQLLGGRFGGQDDDDRRRMRVRDLVSRYDRGPSYEGIPGDEAYHNDRAVASRLRPQEYEESTAEAFRRVLPQERMRCCSDGPGGQCGGVATIAMKKMMGGR